MRRISGAWRRIKSALGPPVWGHGTEAGSPGQPRLRPRSLSANMRPMLPTLFLSAALGADPTSLGAKAELSGAIAEAELKAHVYRLASPEFLGRRGPGAARASQYIAAAFEKLKLVPAFGDSYFQPIPWLLANGTGAEPGFVGRNVAAVLSGSDPALKDEWVLLSAHFDHLG